MAVIDVLLSGLNAPDPAARLEMIRVLGTLEETQALPAFRTLVDKETDPTVREALKWAGSAIWQAQQNGYSTEAAIRKHFRLDLIPTAEEKLEAEKLADIQRKMEIDTMKDKERAQQRQARNTLTMGVIGTAIGGVSMGAGMMLSSASAAAAPGPESGLGPRPTIGAQAIPPQRPSDADISIWVRRLADPNTRKTALLELATLNNPAALPHLSKVFVTETDLQIKEAAQRAAKTIYFNWVHREAQQATQPPKPAPSTPEQTQRSVADILTKAEAARAKKRKTQI